MNKPISKFLLSAGALAALTSTASAQFCVDPSDPTCFPDIQTAVDAVSTLGLSTATIRVEPGTYAPFTVDSTNNPGNFDLRIEGPASGAKPVIDGGSSSRCITIVDGPKLSLRSLSLRNGFSSTNGGGVSATGTDVTLFLLDAEDCLADDNGGGFYVESLQVEPALLFNCTAIDCASWNGGGFFVNALDSSATPELNGCQATDCRADNVGGGFVATSCSARFNSSVALGNTGSRGAGGFLLEAGPNGNTDFAMTECRAENNVVGLGENSVWGAGIAVTGGADIQGSPAFASLLRVIVRGNGVDPNEPNSDVTGAGIWIGNQASVTLDYGVIEDNVGQFGGGLYSDSRLLVEVFNSTFCRNEARAIGSGAFAFGGDGGGVLIETADIAPVAPQFVNVLMVENVADGDGGAAQVSEVGALFQTCTVDNNTASTTGGLSFRNGSLGVVNSCLLQNNSGDQLAVADQLVFSNVVGSFVANNTASNISVAQVYDDSMMPTLWQPRTDYYLLPGSACINAGDALPLGLAPYLTATTQVSGTPDTGAADIGFHYMGAQVPPTQSSLTTTLPNPLLHTDTTLYGFTLTATTNSAPGTTSSVAVLLGSASPLTLPIPVGGISLPISFDSYTNALINGLPGGFPYIVPFDNTTGTASWSFQLPPGLNMPAMPSVLSHAACVLDITSNNVIARAPSQAVSTTYQ